MKVKTEVCTGTLHREADNRWYAATQLLGKVYLAPSLQARPHPSVDGVDVEVTIHGIGTAWTVVDYHFI